MIADIIIVALIVIGMIIGIVYGFKKSFRGLMGVVVSFLITFFVAGLVAGALLNVEAIAGFLYGEHIFGSLIEIIPYSLTGEGGFAQMLMYPFMGYINTGAAALEISTHTATVAVLVFLIFTSVVAFVLYWLVRMVFAIISFAVRRSMLMKAATRENGGLRPRTATDAKRIMASKTPKKKPASRLGGGLIGGMRGLILVVTVFVFFGFLAPMSTAVTENLDGSFMANPIFEFTNQHLTTRVASFGIGNIQEQVNAILERDEVRAFAETDSHTDSDYDYSYANGGDNAAGDNNNDVSDSDNSNSENEESLNNEDGEENSENEESESNAEAA